MIDRTHKLPITRQADALAIARSTVCVKPRPVSERDLDLMNRIDRLHLEMPFAGSRMLRGLKIDRPNQAWCMDITYLPMARGFVYLTAVVDRYSRKVLAWRVSITMDVYFCLEALEDAIARYGTPEIMNTDQGSQFTSLAFTTLLKEHGIRISMDGKGAPILAWDGGHQMMYIFHSCP